MAFTPLPTKSVTITISSISVQLNTCELQIDGSLLRMMPFGETLDADGMAWALALAGGFNEAVLRLSGHWDDSEAPTDAPAGGPGLRNGKSVTVTFTLASGVAFSFPGLVASLRTSAATANKAVEFSCEVWNHGAVTWPS